MATLWSTAKRDGSAGVLSGQLRRGKPGTVTPGQWEQAGQWRAEGASDAEIGRRLGVAHTTIGRGLGERQGRPRRRRRRRTCCRLAIRASRDGGAVLAAQMAPVPEPAAAAREPGLPPGRGRSRIRRAGR